MQTLAAKADTGPRCQDWIQFTSDADKVQGTSLEPVVEKLGAALDRVWHVVEIKMRGDTMVWINVEGLE